MRINSNIPSLNLISKCIALTILTYVFLQNTVEAACNDANWNPVTLSISGPRNVGMSPSVTNTYTLNMTYNSGASVSSIGGQFAWQYNTNQLTVAGAKNGQTIKLITSTTNISDLVETAQLRCYYNNPLWHSEENECAAGPISVKIYKVGVQYLGGSNATNATAEEITTLDKEYFLPGYMLKLAVASNITSEVEWEVSVGGNSNGTYHAGIAWTNYLSRLAAAPEANSVYWRAGWRDITMPGEYKITSTFTPPGSSSELTTTRIIKSRSLDATNEALRDHFNEDVDMLQRAMIQVFYLDKGRLDSYRIGCYDKGSIAGFYHSSLSSRAERDWSSIADEAWNFNKFALNSATDTATCPVTSSTVEGIWYQFNDILRAEDGVAELSGSITTNHILFATWQGPVTNVLSGSIPVAGVTPCGLMDALIEQESEGIHSYVRHDPLAVCSVGIGEAIYNYDHAYTDGGIGFCKVQPYNRRNRNLYKPSDNMICSSGILCDNIDGVDMTKINNDTTLQLWYAVFKYNAGNYGNYQTPTILRRDAAASAVYADEIFTTIGLSRQ